MKLRLNGSDGPVEVIPVTFGDWCARRPEHASDDIRPGLYLSSLPRRPFSTCGRFLLLSTYGLCEKNIS